MFIDDVSEGDLWIFPAGSPHSIQGLGTEGCEFLLVFNQGSFSEESTFLLSDWLMHTPPDVLSKNTGLSLSSIAKLPKADPLYIFPSNAPTQSLEQDREEAARHALKPKEQYTFKASTMTPTFSSSKGSVKIVDLKNFPCAEIHRTCVFAAIENRHTSLPGEPRWLVTISRTQGQTIAFFLNCSLLGSSRRCL